MGVVLGSVVLWYTGSHYRLFRPWSPWSPLSPSPSSFFLSFCAVLVVSALPWSVACLFPGGAVCWRVRGVSSSGASLAAWSSLAAFSGRASSGPAGWSLGVLSVGPMGAALGVAWLQGLPASVEWVRGFAVVWLSLLLSRSPWLAGVRLWGGEGHSAVSCS